MKLFSYVSNGHPAIGVIVESSTSLFVPLSRINASLPSDMTRLLELADWKVKLALGVQEFLQSPHNKEWLQPVERIRLLPVVPRPPKIICMGLNYADHAKEGGNARPDYPSFFLRSAMSQVAHAENLVRPMVSDKLDFEAELAVIIGSRAKHLSAANALSCVAGYSCYNDGSVRDYQRKSNQWTIGKNFDSTGGFGPWMVTTDELPAGAKGLRVQTRLNGRVMQDGNTADFLFDVTQALCLISECMTLEPGDVVITGTPAGVGYARTPPVFMTAGDVCEIDIEGIGVLRNGICDESAGH
jgi:2-keto-4-pentenoate hydratase/2-oxohepta-3-ene-1,7-dioic acid hydratase in catechol pathway